MAQTPATSAHSSAPRSSTSNRTAGPSILRNQNDHSLPSTPSKKKPSPLSSPITATRVRDDAHFKTASAASRKTADTVTYVIQQCLSISLVLSIPSMMQDYVGGATQRAGRCEFRGSVKVRGCGFLGVRGMTVSALATMNIAYCVKIYSKGSRLALPSQQKTRSFQLLAPDPIRPGLHRMDRVGHAIWMESNH